MMKTTILIADDHLLLREAWKFVIESDSRYIVIAECSNGKEAVRYTKTLRPDVVLLDINMPDFDGIQAMQQINQEALPTKVLAVSGHTQPAYALKMFRLGAQGYLSKTSSVVALFDALSNILNGKKYVCPQLKNAIAEDAFKNNKKGVNNLTSRETQIIDLLKKGLSSKEIAKQLNLALKTIEFHRYNILHKLELKNTAALVNFSNNFFPV